MSDRELEAAEGARALLRSPFLTEALDELRAISHSAAIHAATPADREDARHQVIAIDRLRAALVAVVEVVETREQTAVLRRAME